MESMSPELQNLVSKILSENNITNYTLEVDKKVSNEGDGYIGILKGLSVIDRDTDKTIDLVVKKAPANEDLRKQFPTRTFFLREICMYEQVIPELLSFQEDYNIPNPFKSVTKLYGYINDEFKETLLLKNLKEDGYKLYNRREPVDSHHLSLVITEYAKLHALSLALKKLRPEKFEKIRELIGGNIMEEFQKHGQKNEGQGGSAGADFADKQSKMFFSSTIEAVKNKPKLLEALKKFQKNFFQYIMEEFQDKEHIVVSHGDGWSANLLFKYKDQEKPKIPTNLCIIDWQMSYLGSPVHDISFFFFVSAAKDELENYERYLHLYHTALSETLQAFGIDAEDVYSFKVLEQQWKQKSKMGFFKCLIMLQQSLAEGKTHDFEEMAKDGKSVFDMSHRKNDVSDLFKQRMGDLVEFLVEHDLI